MGCAGRSKARKSGQKKGQLFFLGVVFLVGLIFVVQQILMGYTTFDASQPPNRAERFSAENIVSSVKSAVAEAPSCQAGTDSLKYRMDEMKQVIESSKSSGLGSVSLYYVIDCSNWSPGANVLNLTVSTAGTGSESRGFFMMARPKPPEVSISSDNYATQGSPVDIPVRLKNEYYEVSGLEFTLEFLPTVLEFQGVYGAGKGVGFIVENGTIDPGKQYIMLYHQIGQGGISEGDGEILDLRFLVRGMKDQTSDLNISNLIVTDMDGNGIPGATARNGSFTVRAGPPTPILSVSPTTLPFTAVFGNNEKFSGTFSVRNIGGGSMAWEITENTPWLTVNHENGINDQTVTVNVDSEGVPLGMNTETITVTSTGTSGSPKTVTVNLNIVRSAPILDVSPPSLVFDEVQGATSVGKDFLVKNTGPADSSLDWTASPTTLSGGSWLSVSPDSGTGIAGSGSQVVKAAPVITGLSPGTHKGSITVTETGGQTKTVSVTLNIASGPVLNVTPSSMSFIIVLGSTIMPPPKQFNITNIGAGTLDWTASPITETGGNWMAINQSSGTANSTVNVSIPGITGIAKGEYRGNVTVTATTPGASKSPQNMTVTLMLIDGPVLDVSPLVLSFAGLQGHFAASDSPKQLRITNTGIGTMNWRVRTVTPWLVLGYGPTSDSRDISGSVDADKYADIVVYTVNADALLPGINPGSIDVSANTFLWAYDSENVPVTLTITPVARLYLPKYDCQVIEQIGGALMYFEGYQGGATQLTNTFTINNSKSGSMAWTTSSNVTWLTVNPATGTDNKTVTATVTIPTTMTPGNHYGKVTVSATTPGTENTPRSICALLRLNPPAVAPALQVSTNSMTLVAEQGGQASQQFTVTNAGTGTMAWTASASTLSGGNWLSVSPASGTESASGSHAVTVTVSPGGLAVGDYLGAVTVTATTTGTSGSPKVINIRLTVTRAIPVLQASPGQFLFTATSGGSSPVPQTLSISNGGSSYSSLTWSITHDMPWLTVTPSTSGTGSATLTVAASTGTLSPTTYTGTIRIDGYGATGSPKPIAVTFTVNPPEPALGVSPQALSFGATVGGSSPASQSFTVSNTGGGNLLWSASVASTGNWLSVTPTAGMVGGGMNMPVTVNVNSAGLAAGTYTGTVTVTSNNAAAGTSPKTVSVTLTVGQPILQVSSYSFYFSANQGTSPPAQRFTISNGGTGDLAWTITKNQPWLSVDRASGTGNADVNVNVDTSTLSPSTDYYVGTITVSSSNAIASSTPKNIIVYLMVTSPSTLLSVSPNSLRFDVTQGGTTTIGKTFTVTDNGGGSTVWYLYDYTDWITTFIGSRPAMGYANMGTQTVGVYVQNYASLPMGTYYQNIDVSTGDLLSTKTVQVELNVGAGVPALQVIPNPDLNSLVIDAFRDGLNPVSKPFSINNSRGGPMAWTLSESMDWLTTSDVSGNGNTTVRAIATINDGIPLGSSVRRGYITITAQGATGSPKNLEAVLNVYSQQNVSASNVSVPARTATVTVPINMTNKYPVGNFSAEIWYDTTVLTFSSVQATDRSNLMTINWNLIPGSGSIRKHNISITQPFSYRYIWDGAGPIANVVFTLSPSAPSGSRTFANLSLTMINSTGPGDYIKNFRVINSTVRIV